MSTRRRNALIAVVAGLIVAAGVTAIAATQFGNAHNAVVVAQSSASVSGGNGGSFNAQPGLGGNGGGFSGQPGLGGPNGQPRLGGGDGGGGFRNGFFGGISAAASYLGITAQELQTDITSGKTLAQVAKAKGKTAGGLVSAMITAQRSQLDAAVSAGQFTKQQENLIVSALTQRYTAMVNGTVPSGRGFGGGGFGGGDDGGGGAGGGGSFGSGSGGSAGGGSSLGGATTPA